MNLSTIPFYGIRVKSDARRPSRRASTGAASWTGLQATGTEGAAGNRLHRVLFLE